MSNEEILRKAIAKIKWQNDMFFWWGPEWLSFLLNDSKYGENFYRVIFRHDFAKAFWGEGPTFKNSELKEYNGELDEETGNVASSAWQYHLQQMVLEDDPIKYLEKFI